MNVKIRLFLIFSSLFFLCLLLTQFIPIIRPFPKLTGAYKVGTTTLYFKDENRQEVYSDNPNDKRELMVQVWYPAENTKSYSRNLYLSKKIKYAKEKLVKEIKFPEFLWQNFLGNIYTNSFLNAPVNHNDAPYPVIIFSPGAFHGTKEIYSVFTEELASHGYIVFGIDHPYGVFLTILPGEKPIFVLKRLKDLARDPQTQADIENRKRESKVWIEDIEFIFKELKELNNSEKSIFYKVLDLNKVAVMGQSFGGAIAIEVCKNFDFCKVGIDMDGWTKGVNDTEPFKKPFLFIVREDGAEKEIHELCAKMGKYCELNQINGTYHRSFSDYILAKMPITLIMGDKYIKNPYKIINEINEAVVSFLSRNLKQ